MGGVLGSRSILETWLPMDWVAPSIFIPRFTILETWLFALFAAFTALMILAPLPVIVLIDPFNVGQIARGFAGVLE